MITVIAEIKAKPGRRAAVVEAFAKIIPLVLAEEGCGGYQPLVDADAGVSFQHKAADSIIMLEQWASVSHLEKHLQIEHMQQHRERVKDDVLEVKIQILENAL